MATREVKFTSNGAVLPCENCLPADIILAVSPALVNESFVDLYGFITATLTHVSITRNGVRTFTFEYDDAVLNDPDIAILSTDIFGFFCFGLKEKWITNIERLAVSGNIPSSRSIFTTAPLMGGGDFSMDRTHSITQATALVDGFLSAADWNVFNSKVGTSRNIATTSPLYGGGDLSADLTLGISLADDVSDGYLSSVDWNTFNDKVSTTRSIFTTAPITGGGDLSADRTIGLANTAVTPGTYNFSTITVDAQGRITAATTGVPPAPTTPAGANTQIQYNDSGVFGADTGLTFIKATDTLAVTGFAEGVRLILTHTGSPTSNILEMRNSGSAVMTAFSPVGYLKRGADIFLHDFGASNSIFLGVSAGNQVAAAASHNNIGIGTLALNSLSGGTASGNTVVGSIAASGLTTGTLNTIIGSYAAADLTTGSSNTIVGSGATWVLSTGSQNTVIGAASIGANVSGATAIGHGAQLSNSYTMILGSSGVNAPLVSIGGNPGPIGQLQVQSRSATTPTSIFRAFLAQSVNTTEWQTSTATVVASMNALGQLTVTPGGNVVTYDRTISTTAPLTGGGDLSANRTFGLANTAVTPGSYTSTNLTVDAQGRITAASNGISGTGAVPESRMINTTGPLVGGGDLSSDRTISIPAATTAVNGYLTSADWNIFNNKVATTRTISTTLPLTGGGDLSANRTLGINDATATTNGTWAVGAQTLSGQKIIQSQAVGHVALALKTFSGAQTADIQQWQNSSGTPYAVVNTSGSFGLGTALPQRELHVKDNIGGGSVNDYQLILEGVAGGYGAGVSFQSTAAGTLKEMGRITADGTAPWDATAANQDSSMSFFTSLDGVLTKRLSILSDGATTVTGSFTATTITAPGSNTQVLFNDGGNIGADNGLTYAKATDNLSIIGFADGVRLTLYATGSPTANLLEMKTSGSVILTAFSKDGYIFRGTQRFLHDYGTNDVFLGKDSGNFTTTGGAIGQNVGVGDNSLNAISTGYRNVAVGHSAMYQLTGGLLNTGIGSVALGGLTTGNENVGLGYSSGSAITTGLDNIAIGFGSAALLTTGNYNTFVGANSGLVSSTQRSNSMALGYGAKVDQDKVCAIGGTAASGNNLKVVIGGTTAGAQLQVHSEAVGVIAALFRPFSVASTAALTDWQTTAGASLTSIGVEGHVFRAGTRFLHDTGSYSTFLGANAGNITLTSSNGYNTGLGSRNLNAITTGNFNTAVGSRSLELLTTGSGNVAVGDRALSGSLTTASDNTAVGTQAGNGITGDGNTCIGSAAGQNGFQATSTTNSLFIGVNSGLASATQRNRAVAIGYSAKVDADNTMALGGTSSNALKVVINGTLANAQLHVNSDAAGTVGFLVRGAASQSTDLAQLQDNSGFIKALFDKQGRPTFANTVPTIAAGAGAGTGPTISIVGSDVCGVIQVTTGSAPTTGGNIVRVTFSTPYANVPKAIILTPANSMTSNIPSANIPYVNAAGATTSYFDFNVATSGTLNAATAYVWYYLVIG